MLKKSLTIAKTNLANIKSSYIVTAIVIGMLLIQDIVYIILGATGVYTVEAGNMTVSIGNCFFLIIILAAINIASSHFQKIMHLGAKRITYFYGCIMTYAVISAVVSVIAIILYFTYDNYMTSAFIRAETMDVVYWFGWAEQGVVVIFFRLFTFLLLLAVVIHTLVAVQGRWYGWIADFLIVAIISVFTPIAILRRALVWFFNLIIFHSNSFVQIAVCLVLAAAIYLLNKPILARKII